MVNSGVMRHRVLGITNSDKYVILRSTKGYIYIHGAKPLVKPLTRACDSAVI